jgi:ABC-type multidrug transport system ATPase subunit
MRIDGLSFGYGARLLFQDFGFETTAPITILSGRTGCGKTTLLKLICRVLTPSAEAMYEVPSESALLLQEDALFPWLTARQNIAIVPRLRRKIPEHPLMNRLVDLLDKPVFQLSFGQRRLVELYRALMLSPSLLCLDEPFNFLDPQARQEVADLIQTTTEDGTRFILSTHHQEDIALFAATVYGFPEETPLKGLLLR